MDKIPSKISNIVKDKEWSETFIFESMECSHSDTASKSDKVDCLRCNCDSREIWLEDLLTTADLKETLIVGKKTQILKEIIVIRGKFDDCIGVEKLWQ